ncbi:MAG: hypothetical protein HUU27_05535, partial [Phycisphaerae bacterium]|nr:hypothetical protein [Phycisphaerae bacterium]
LDRRRDELLARLLENVAALHAVGQAAPERRVLEAELRRDDAEIERLTAERQALLAATDEMAADAPPLDRITAAVHPPVMVSGLHRERNAAVAAGVAFAVVLGIGMLMVVRAPARRRASEHPDDAVDRAFPIGE